MTTKYKMFSEQDKANFRAWLGRCPCPECAEFLSSRRSVGAFDVKENGNGEGKPNELPPRYTRENARRCLQFLARKLDAKDLGRAWEMMQPRIEWDRTPRRNGHAG